MVEDKKKGSRDKQRNKVFVCVFLTKHASVINNLGIIAKANKTIIFTQKTAHMVSGHKISQLESVRRGFALGIWHFENLFGGTLC